MNVALSPLPLPLSLLPLERLDPSRVEGTLGTCPLARPHLGGGCHRGGHWVCARLGVVPDSCSIPQALLSPRYGTVAAETPYENSIKMCNVP